MPVLKKLLTSKYLWITLGLVLVIWSFIPEKEYGPEIPLGKKGMTLLGSYLVGWENREQSYEVKAKEIWRSEDEKLIIIHHIEKAVFLKNNNRDREFSFSADWARIEENKDLLLIGGGVKGRIDDGTFETEEVRINMETEDITVPGTIVYTEDGTKIEAARMEGNLDTEVLVFSGAVTLTDSDSRVCGERLRYFGKEKRFEIEKELKVELEL